MRTYIAKWSTFSYLDNNEYVNAYNRFEMLAGAGVDKELDWEDIANCDDWVMGHINFECNQFIKQSSKPTFDNYSAFLPEYIIYIPFEKCELIISTKKNSENILGEILSTDIPKNHSPKNNDRDWVLDLEEEEYIKTIEKIRDDIFYGQYYELNYCVNAKMEDVNIDPISIFNQQNKINPSPFSALYRNDKDYLICGSPERFLFRANDKIVTQPIKGTTLRSSEKEKDETLKKDLHNNIKERAENVMIVDLSRNDLALCCETGSIEVEELFGIYSFPFVHQMISTITGKLKPEENLNTIFQKIYPMGSMTGAPKKTVIDHIQQYEKRERGIYSGSLFYKMPNGDFDSNVVIRSLVYNTETKILSYHTGSAITYYSEAKKEWDELQWKATSMKNALTNEGSHIISQEH